MIKITNEEEFNKIRMVMLALDQHENTLLYRKVREGQFNIEFMMEIQEALDQYENQIKQPKEELRRDQSIIKTNQEEQKVPRSLRSRDY